MNILKGIAFKPSSDIAESKMVAAAESKIVTTAKVESEVLKENEAAEYAPVEKKKGGKSKSIKDNSNIEI
ncbi:MAG: hypothetical protein HQK73_06245 [Desulfamplus sp.]|nr:hypothetical protein [Desulfamplus sp.]